MKILHVCWSLLTGGIENILVDIINYQLESNEVHLLIINDKINESILNRINDRCCVKCYYRKGHSRNIFTILRINAYIQFNNFDIIHLHNQDLIKIMLMKHNYVRTVHSTAVTYINYKWHKKIIAISESVREVLEHNNIEKDVVTINNGVNFDEIKKCERINISKPFKIVQVSRIIFEQKGQDILLNAIIKLINKGYEISLDFIGEGPDTDKLSMLIKQNQIEKNVSLLGNRQREFIYDNLCNYNLFVQPSRIEGFGLTVVEAIGAKIPVLVSDIEGPMQIVDNGKYGFTFSNLSVDDCASKIEYIINNYPDESYLNSAYEHAKKLYHVKQTAQEYINLYNEIIRDK